MRSSGSSKKRSKIFIPVLVGIALAAFFLSRWFPAFTAQLSEAGDKLTEQLPSLPVELATRISHPLMIEVQRQKAYPGSEIVREEELPAGANYEQYVASYQSDGLKIYGLLTIPTGTPPEGGWPAIIFNHGYIPPEQYRTTQRYEAYVNGFARQGFVVFKPDFRGHGDSEGEPQGAYYSDGYIADVMNALASVRQMPEVNPQRVGMWGHSMGGHLTLRAMVISKDVKAGVIWAGVVGSYQDMMYNWRRSRPWQPSPQEQQLRERRPGRQSLIDQFGGPDANAAFWDSISPIKFVSDISGPVQIHHGTADGEVPWEFSQSLEDVLETAGKPVELYLYQGADHNLSGAAFSPALNRSVEFFKANL